jgi:hypothetical protein
MLVVAVVVHIDQTVLPVVQIPQRVQQLGRPTEHSMRSPQ